MNASALGLLGTFSVLSSVAVAIVLGVNQIVVGFWLALVSFFLFAIVAFVSFVIELESNWSRVVLGIVMGAFMSPIVYYIASDLM